MTTLARAKPPAPLASPVIPGAGAPGAVLYEQVAEHVARLIRGGTFRPGDRVPSVRKLHAQLGVSITTVLEAYRLMEDRGLIEARPQSGYYVRPHASLRAQPAAAGGPAPPPCDEPRVSKPSRKPVRVNVSDRIDRIAHDMGTPGLIQLGAAIPDPAVLPNDKLLRLVAQVAREGGDRLNGYDALAGNPELRQQIARRAMYAGCTLTPEEIVTTVGGQEALCLCLRAVCKPGDTVAVESPVFYGTLQALEALGLKAVEVAMHPRDGMSLEALEDILSRHRIRAVLSITNYNNPLGSCMPEENKRRLVAMLAPRQIPLIEDDIYGDLSFSPQRPRCAKSFDEQGLVLLCSSFSKTLAPGFRVGWCAPGRFQKRVEHLKFISTIATPTLPQMAIARFLENGGYDRFLRRVRRIYAQNVSACVEAVSRYFPAGTRVSRPQGGFVVWVEMPPQYDALALYDRAICHKISIVPGHVFSTKPKYTNCLRLNAGQWSDRALQAVIRLGELLAEM